MKWVQTTSYVNKFKNMFEIQNLAYLVDEVTNSGIPLIPVEGFWVPKNVRTTIQIQHIYITRVRNQSLQQGLTSCIFRPSKMSFRIAPY
jgi:hypothetical protein